MKPKFLLDIDDLGVEYQDAGPWRDYSMQSEGDSKDDLLSNAQISEIDQDGGELRNYSLSSIGGELARAGEKAIEGYLEDYKNDHCSCTSDALCRIHLHFRRFLSDS